MAETKEKSQMPYKSIFLRTIPELGAQTNQVSVAGSGTSIDISTEMITMERRVSTSYPLPGSSFTTEGYRHTKREGVGVDFGYAGVIFVRRITSPKLKEAFEFVELINSQIKELDGKTEVNSSYQLINLTISQRLSSFSLLLHTTSIGYFGGETVRFPNAEQKLVTSRGQIDTFIEGNLNHQDFFLTPKIILGPILEGIELEIMAHGTAVVSIHYQKPQVYNTEDERATSERVQDGCGKMFHKIRNSLRQKQS